MFIKRKLYSHLSITKHFDYVKFSTLDGKQRKTIRIKNNAWNNSKNSTYLYPTQGDDHRDSSISNTNNNTNPQQSSTFINSYIQYNLLFSDKIIYLHESISRIIFSNVSGLECFTHTKTLETISITCIPIAQILHASQKQILTGKQENSIPSNDE